MKTTSTERGHFTDDLKRYSVTLWGSNPDETDNDDCWTGDDFVTREEAIAFYQEVVMFPTSGRISDGVAHKMIRGCGHWEFVMIDGPDAHEVTANPDQAACRRHRRELRQSNAAWRREVANEAGMLHGIEAHDEVMGY